MTTASEIKVKPGDILKSYISGHFGVYELNNPLGFIVVGNMNGCGWTSPTGMIDYHDNFWERKIRNDADGLEAYKESIGVK